MYMTSGAEETEAYMRWLYVRTMQLLRRPENQAAIRDVADALLEHGEVRATSVRALVVAAIHRTVNGARGRSPLTSNPTKSEAPRLVQTARGSADKQ